MTGGRGGAFPRFGGSGAGGHLPRRFRIGSAPTEKTALSKNAKYSGASGASGAVPICPYVCYIYNNDLGYSLAASQAGPTNISVWGQWGHPVRLENVAGKRRSFRRRGAAHGGKARTLALEPV